MIMSKKILAKKTSKVADSKLPVVQQAKTLSKITPKKYVSRKISRLTPNALSVIKRLLMYKGHDNEKIYPKQNIMISVNDERSKYKHIYTPHLVSNNGWLIGDLLEIPVKNGVLNIIDKEAVYASNKQWDIFTQELFKKRQLIEIALFKYRDEKKRYHTKQVYRERRDLIVNLWIFEEIYNTDKEFIYEFLASDYFQDSEFKIVYYQLYNLTHGIKVRDKLLIVDNSVIDKIYNSETMSKEIYITKALLGLNKDVILPPSYVYEILKKTKDKREILDYDLKEIIGDLDFKDVLKSYYITDYTQCTNPKYKQMLYDEIKKLENGGLEEVKNPEHKKPEKK